MTMTIRVWKGCQVQAILTVTGSGHSLVGSVGGAENSSLPDIEIDPWAGLIVDHGANTSPVDFRRSEV